MGGFNFNPILSEIQSHFSAMSPEAQGAVHMAGMTPPAPDPTTTAPGKIAPGMLLPHPDAGAPQGPIGMESQTPPLTMPSQTPQLVTGPKRGQEMMSGGQQVRQGTVLGDTAERGRLLDEGPPVNNIYHNITTSGFGENHPFLGKLLGGVAEVGGKIGDTLANGLPGIGREIPGTTVNHSMLLKQANANLTEDVGNAQKEAQTASENATAGKTNAETPEVAPDAESKRALEGAQASAVPSEIAERGAQTAHLGAETADMQAGKPMESSAGLLQVKPDGTAQRITVDGQPVGPPLKTEVKQIEVNGKPHQVLINSETGDHLRDLGETGEKPPTVNVNAGEKNLWSVPQPDGSKKVVSLKPGDTIPNGAVSLSGQSQQNSKEGTADAPTISALRFANEYLKSGQYTGPSDEALQDQFFQMAKPSTGFRMNQAQIDQLHHMASWIQSAEGIAFHAQTGTWFAPQQREQIVKTMNDLAKSKGIDVSGANENDTKINADGDKVVRKGGKWVPAP